MLIFEFIYFEIRLVLFFRFFSSANFFLDYMALKNKVRFITRCSKIVD